VIAARIEDAQSRVLGALFMGRMLTLVVDLRSAPAVASPPHGYTLRPCRPSDISDLGRLYFEAYDPGIACSSLPEAVADIEAVFAGSYGELWHEASLVAVAEGERLVAAIQVVRCAPWEDTPDSPFVIELFTSRVHRRLGLGHALVGGAMAVVGGANHDTLALRVDEDNTSAPSLYRSLGFYEWTVGI